MKHHNMGSLIIGLAAFVLTISVYFFIMKSFLDTYDVSENKPVFKGPRNAVIPGCIWDPHQGHDIWRPGTQLQEKISR